MEEPKRDSEIEPLSDGQKLTLEKMTGTLFDAWQTVSILSEGRVMTAKRLEDAADDLYGCLLTIKKMGVPTPVLPRPSQMGG